MMKHVDVKHPNLAQKLLEKVSSMARGPMERWPTKKRTGIDPNTIFDYFGCVGSFKKDHP
jgi:hypothetical protein